MVGTGQNWFWLIGFNDLMNSSVTNATVFAQTKDVWNWGRTNNCAVIGGTYALPDPLSASNSWGATFGLTAGYLLNLSNYNGLVRSNFAPYCQSYLPCDLLFPTFSTNTGARNFNTNSGDGVHPSYVGESNMYMAYVSHYSPASTVTVQLGAAGFGYQAAPNGAGMFVINVEWHAVFCGAGGLQNGGGQYERAVVYGEQWGAGVASVKT